MDGIEMARKLIAEEQELKTGFLDLGNLGLMELPHELFDLGHLRSLNLGRRYRDLDGQFQESANTGRSNSFSSLPKAFRKLNSLRYLSLFAVPVSTLAVIPSLPSLQSLDCWGTKVSDLSPLHGMASLESLDCSQTEVSDLNPLPSVPKLSQLSVNLCRLQDFPSLLLSHPALKELHLHETVTPCVPPEVLSKSAEDNCLERLRNHMADLQVGSEEVRETKLIVLGNGRVGKTQICRRLRGLPFDSTIASTHGITVTSEPWSGSSEGESLNIWDFGGQDIYHGAHTLFMRTRAIFLIAWHPDFEGAREQEHEGLFFRNYPLSYWLEYVRTLGRKGSPVITVQSQCDRAEQEAKRLPVDEQFLAAPFLKQCWYSAAKDRGRRALDEAIEEAVHFLRDREGVATIGEGRMKVLRQLVEWREADRELPPAERRYRTLTQIEFGNLCQSARGVASPESLLDYLHNVGVIFYRKELFHDRIILDQSWALDGVYAVFERTRSFRQITGQSGRFTQSLLSLMVWSEYSDAEQRLFLSLMKSCGICFIYRPEIERLGTEAEYIAPDLLPDKESVADQLAGRWDGEDSSRRLVFEYEFLHPGLMRCIVCDAGEHAGEAGVYWKYGVWVYERDTGARAIIEQEMADERRGRITARIQGRRDEQLAKWIRERLQNRNRLFRDLESGSTIMVSRLPGGIQGNRDSYLRDMTPDGGSVVFESRASNFSSEDRIGTMDLFIRRQDGSIEPVGVIDGSGRMSDLGAVALAGDGKVISDDGRWVVFGSRSRQFMTGLPDRFSFFLRDTVSGTNGILSTPINQATYDELAGGGIARDGSAVIFAGSSGVRGSGMKAAVRNVVSGAVTRIEPPPVQSPVERLISSSDGAAVAFTTSDHLSGAYPKRLFVSKDPFDAWIEIEGSAGVLEQRPLAFIGNDRLIAAEISQADEEARVVLKILSADDGAVEERLDTEFGDVLNAIATGDGSLVVFTGSLRNDRLIGGHAGMTVWAWHPEAGTLENLVTRQIPASAPILGSALPDRRGVAFSEDGSKLVFASASPDLVAGDGNGEQDVFVLSTADLSVELASPARASFGTANGISRFPAISGDGRYVAFSSLASDLVDQESGGYEQVYVRDMEGGETILVSHAANEARGGAGGSRHPIVNGDGRYVVYASKAPGLVVDLPDPSAATSGAIILQVYRFDRVTRENELVSWLVEGGGPLQGSSDPLAISTDGRWGAFSSELFANELFVRDFIGQRRLGEFISRSFAMGWRRPYGRTWASRFGPRANRWRCSKETRVNAGSDFTAWRSSSER